MDKKLNKRIETYLRQFKNDIKDMILETKLEPEISKSIIEKVFNYENLQLSEADVVKRKRIKNAIPGLNRCNAKRANGEQCTRKRKEGHTYCGTHVKGTPHGIVVSMLSGEEQILKGEVFAEDICGIVYYIDANKNVYKTEDILNGVKNPSIIAKCVQLQNGKYTIPQFNLIPPN